MNFQKIFVAVGGVLLVAASYRAFGWAGVAFVASGIVMWVLMNFTRMMKVLQRAGNRPIGYVDSTVMLNAKLKPGMTLLHVIAMTRALGALQSIKDAQPEVYRWTDSSDSHVTAEFANGKLTQWQLVRPVQTDALPPSGTPPADAP